MEPLATQTQPESLVTQLARQLLALHVAKTKQQEQQALDLATASSATAPPVVGECIKQTAAKQSTKPWLPSGSPSSAWGRTKAKTESGSAISPALNSSRGRSAHTKEWASAPGGTGKQVITDQHSNDSSKGRACRACSSPGQSPNPGRASRSPAKSISPRQHSTAGNSPSTTPKYSTMATRSSSSPGRDLSPLRGSSTAGRLDTSTARLDSTAGSMSAGGSPFDSLSGCAGPGRLPYHEVLQIAYGPPAPSILKTHLDLAAVSSKADPTKQRRVSSTSTGAGATPQPRLPSRDSSRKVTRQTQQEVDDGSTNPGTTAAAAAMGAAVAAATAAAALLTRRSTQDQTRTPPDSALPGTHSTSQELLKGYTTGYIDGRLAALRGPSRDGSASPPVSSAQGAPARPSSSSSRSSSFRQAATPAVDYTGHNPDSFFLRSHDSLSPAQQPLRVPAAAAAPAPDEHRATIRPELVKQIAMKIVSAALASPDKAIAASTASAPLTAAVPDAVPVGPKAAAQALLQANPGQLRNLLEQMQKVLPPQRQQSTEFSAVLPSPHALLQQQQHQQLQMQQQLLHWREDLAGGLPEYSVSAFDRETDAYLIPVSHIGCQTSEVFSDRPHSTRAQPADQAPEAAASTTAAALAQTVLRATAAVVAGATVPASTDCSTTQVARIAEWQLAAQAAAGAAVPPAAPSSDRADGTLLLVCDAPSSGFVSVQHQQQHTPRVDELMQTDAVCEEEQQLQQLNWQAPSTASSLSLSPSLLVPPSPQQQQQQDVLPPQQQTSCVESQQEQEHGDQQAQQQQQVCFPAAEEQPARQAVAGQRQEQPTQPRATPDVDASTVSQDKASISSLARIEELLRAMHSKAFSPQHQQVQQPQQQEQQQQPLVQPVAVQHHSQPALESCSSLSINLDMPLSPTGTGSLVGLQVLERLLSELHVLQSAVKRHAAVDQLELSRLDALMAQVALLSHWLVDRAGTAHPVSAQLALLQQDLQAWRSRVGADVNLQPSGPHSTANALQPSPRSSRDMHPASVSPVPLQQLHSPRGVQHLQTAWQATAASGGTPSPRAAQGLQGAEALPEQQLLQPILSGGLIRARNTGSMPGSWPVGLPPVQEGRESECDTASSVGEVASVHSLPPSRGPSIGGRSSSGGGGSSSSKARSILASVGSSSGRARGEGGPIFQEVPLMPEPQRPAQQQQQQQREKPSEGLSFLKPSGWLSPRGRGSVDQPRSPTSATSRKSVDVQRSRTPSPKKPVLATRSMDGGVADAGGRLPRGASVPLSNRSSSGGGSGSPSSAEKKRGFMLALKQALQENMQQLGGRRELARGSSLRREASQVDARRLTAEALSRVGQ